MKPAQRKHLIDIMAKRGTAELESFFISLGLGEAFARPDRGWGRQKRINEALLEAEEEGRVDEVLKSAAIHFAKATSTGEPAKTPNRIRLDLQELLDELAAWSTWKYTDFVESIQQRYNDALRHLRVHIGSDAPDDFHLREHEYSKSRKTVSENAFSRLCRSIERTVALVPGAESTAAAGPTLRIQALHPLIRRVSEQLFLDGHYAAAILEAFKAVNNRVRSMAAAVQDGKGLMAFAFSESRPIIKLNDLLTQSQRDEQEGFKLIFMGVMLGIRNPKAHDEHPELDEDRALEYLALASLLMRRLDDAKT